MFYIISISFCGHGFEADLSDIHFSIIILRQVTVLTEQVEAQTERLREMEYQLEGRRQKMQYAEEKYQNVGAKCAVF